MIQAPNPSRPIVHRRYGLFAAATALLLLAACQSKTDKADALEAIYDRQMAAQSFGKALQSIQTAVKLDENEARRWLKLAKVQDRLNRPAAAAVSYQHALDLQPSSTEALEALSIMALRGGQFEMAKRYVDPLLLMEPNNFVGLLTSAAVALREKRYTEADRLAGQIIAGAPMVEEGYVLRARIMQATGRNTQARKLLEERLAADPQNKDIPRELLTLYQKQGDRAGIRRMAIILATMFPDQPAYALEAARGYHAQGRDGETRKIMAQLLTRYPGNISIATAVAGLMRSVEPPAAAAREIEALAAKSPPHVRVALADMLTGMGEAARAEGLLAYVAEEPVTVKNVDAHASLARARYALKKMADVQNSVDALLEFDDHNPVGLLLRARLELARGDFRHAATDAGVVASDDDNNEEASLLIAAIYAAQGNALLAGKAYGDARENFPESPRVMQAQAEWLIGQKRAQEAINIATTFAHGRPGQREAWRAYRNVCLAAKNPCASEALRVFPNL